MRQDTYVRRQTGRRRTSNRRYRTQEYESSGNGWMILGLIGLMLIGAYFFMEDDQKVQLVQWANQVKEKIFPMDDTEIVPEDPAGIVNEVPILCTQGNIAKIMAYTLMDVGQMQPAKVGEVWYHKYYELLKQDERFSFLDEQYVMNPLTYKEAENVIVAVLGDTYRVTLEMDEKLASEYITLDEFLEVYEQALSQSGQTHGLEYKELSILATPATHTDLSAWKAVTSEGIYGFEGIILDPYKDYTIKAITKDEEILGVVEVLSNQAVIQECFIEKVEDQQVTIQVDGIQLVYASDVLTQADVGQVGAITLYNSKIIDYNLQVDKDIDTILKVTDSTIEFARGGVIPYDEILVYNGTEEGHYTSKSQLFSGMQVTYTLEGEKLSTVKVVGDQVGDDVRVVLTSDGLGDYLHDTVIIASEEDCLVTYGDRKLKLEAGTVWDVSSFEWEGTTEKLVITPENNGTIEIQSMTRQKIHPTYSGTLEIYKEEVGYEVVNVLTMEEYVACVIPSEMPTSYGLEAAKVQAVAARSYAKAHQKNSKFVKYGAQLDDTTSSQVYNNVATNDIAKQAAEATKGQVMTHNDRIISGNFFATSCGYTANYGQTWAAGEDFPTNTPVYLMAQQQYVGDREAIDLTDEEQAYKFFTTEASEIDAFDNHSPWFRWQVQLTKEEINHVVNSNVYRLTTQYPNMVKVLDEKENKWITGEVNSVGEIQDIEIRERGTGGNIMELVVIGDEAVIQVSTEYLIRCLLAPIQKDSTKGTIQVERADGSCVDNMVMLPSAFFSMDIEYSDNAISELVIYGGGFGHGVGMSQDGVKGMVERGYDYEEILKHYYSNIEIKGI